MIIYRQVVHINPDTVELAILSGQVKVSFGWVANCHFETIVAITRHSVS